VRVYEAMRLSALKAAMWTLRRSGAAQMLRPISQGIGVIFTLHRIRPFTSGTFAPNAILEITPEFLDSAITELKRQAMSIISIEEAAEAIKKRQKGFAVFTTDDAYRDVRDYAVPIFQNHNAPYTCYIASGFADRTFGPWWISLEQIIRDNGNIKIIRNGKEEVLKTENKNQKYEVFGIIYNLIRYGCNARLLMEMERLNSLYGHKMTDISKDQCLDWNELKKMMADPLMSIGAHSVSHAILARLSEEDALKEMEESRLAIERNLGHKPATFAYPVGDPSSAGAREFAMAKQLGFEATVTTRPGHVFAEHKDHLSALPRISLNGYFQTREDLRTLLTGAPFLLHNRGRRINVT
jgi:peptidoglycan/xylan/chitin deacetylase (PgdA/CDA1 family)